MKRETLKLETNMGIERGDKEEQEDERKIEKSNE